MDSGAADVGVPEMMPATGSRRSPAGRPVGSPQTYADGALPPTSTGTSGLMLVPRTNATGSTAAETSAASARAKRKSTKGGHGTTRRHTGATQPPAALLAHKKPPAALLAHTRHSDTASPPTASATCATCGTPLMKPGSASRPRPTGSGADATASSNSSGAPPVS